MIGDQLLTDILGAKRLGLFAILVEPLSPYRFLTGRLQRPLELLLLRWLRRLGERMS
jgi:predicted HAD superfamily phosphohydrolase YqeG